MTAVAVTYDVVFYHQWLDAHPLRRSQSAGEAAIDAMTMIRLATGFVRHRAHGGRPVVITNDVGRLAGLTDVAVI
ncbi:MAG: hypothetical protein IT561_26135, partial [Alphaproteobacteria bacterium]|nr:hypothetical protein [Alphaproteobacteria bacterium]